MAAVIIGLISGILVTSYWTPPPFVYTASVVDRTRMSVEVASYIHENSESNDFKSRSVEIGATAIEWPFALADWRSADGKRHGQVLFDYRCDHRNIGTVSIAKPLTVAELTHGFGGMPSVKAAQLIFKLDQLEGQRISFLEPAKPTQGC